MRFEYFLTPKQVRLLIGPFPCWPKTFKFAKLMESGEEFPPVKIHFNEKKNCWSFNDGRTRVAAAKLAGVPLKVRSSKKMGKI